MLEEYLNKIINADCMDVLKKLPDSSIDLVVTSPPYNQEFNRQRHEGRARRQMGQCCPH